MNSTTLLVAPPEPRKAGQPSVAAVEDTPHLVFEVASQPYACPIARAHHLMRREDAVIGRPATGAPCWEVGRLLWGNEEQEIPVVSLRSLWGLPPLAATADQKRQAILIVSSGGRECALLVDACRCVLPSLPRGAARFLLPAPLQTARGRAFKLATPWDSGLLVVLELDQLLQNAHRDSPRMAGRVEFP